MATTSDIRFCPVTGKMCFRDWCQGTTCKFASGSVGNQSEKRVGKKRAAVLATLVVIAVCAFWYAVITFGGEAFWWIGVVALSAATVYYLIRLWKFAFGLFIDKFFS